MNFFNLFYLIKINKYKKIFIIQIYGAFIDFFSYIMEFN